MWFWLQDGSIDPLSPQSCDPILIRFEESVPHILSENVSISEWGLKWIWKKWALRRRKPNACIFFNSSGAHRANWINRICLATATQVYSYSQWLLTSVSIAIQFIDRFSWLNTISTALATLEAWAQALKPAINHHPHQLRHVSSRGATFCFDSSQWLLFSYFRINF